MSKVAVVYWTSTGNTEEMAKAVVEGAKEKGAEVDLFQVSSFNSSMVDNYDGIGLGCSAMGDEELDEDEFLPMWESIKSKLKDKKVALFGSYSWNDGEWMRKWEAEAKENGITLSNECVICFEAPDKDGEKNCKDLGASLV